MSRALSRAMHRRPVTLAQVATGHHNTPDAIDTAIAQAGWITHDGPQYVREVYRLGWLRWRWELHDETGPGLIACGDAPTRRGARGQAWRAYLRVLHADGRADS